MGSDDAGFDGPLGCSLLLLFSSFGPCLKPHGGQESLADDDAVFFVSVHWRVKAKASSLHAWAEPALCRRKGPGPLVPALRLREDCLALEAANAEAMRR